MRSLTLTLALATLMAAPALAQTARTPVYVFTATDPSGLTDDATRERLAAVADIRARLAKNKTVTLAETAEAARITVEVTAIEHAESTGTESSTKRGVWGTAETTTTDKLKWYDYAILRSGTYQTELRTDHNKMFGFGNHPGEQMTKAIETWLAKNAAALTTMGK